MQVQIDDDGSGVAATYYWLDGAAHPTLYSGPFQAPIGSTVQFQSTDKAGNVEDLRQLVVGDASNERTLAATIPFLKPVLRFINPQGDEDWFKFTANGRSSYSVRLHSLPADYDLELKDASGALVAAARTRGLVAEEIRRRLPAGTYYVRVKGNVDAPPRSRPWDHAHPYLLQVLPTG